MCRNLVQLWFIYICKVKERDKIKMSNFSQSDRREGGRVQDMLKNFIFLQGNILFARYVEEFCFSSNDFTIVCATLGPICLPIIEFIGFRSNSFLSKGLTRKK